MTSGDHSAGPANGVRRRTCKTPATTGAATFRWQLSRRKDGQAFITSLGQGRHARPEETLAVALDNVGHRKSRQTLARWPRWPHQPCRFFLPT
jgi:hypothetical protein